MFWDFTVRIQDAIFTRFCLSFFSCNGDARYFTLHRMYSLLNLSVVEIRWALCQCEAPQTLLYGRRKPKSCRLLLIVFAHGRTY